MKRIHPSLLLIRFVMLLGLGLSVTGAASAGEIIRPSGKQPGGLSSWTNTREARTLDKAAASQGNSRYLRWAVHDGNLVTGPTINSGLLAYHYVGAAPLMAWPKGARAVRYIHGGVFYCAAEVKDALSNTIHIVSDNYRRSSAESSADLSHWYAFMPLGRYFNLDQPGSLETPEVYGISEDTGLDGVPYTGDYGEDDGILQKDEDYNRNGELDVSLQNTVGWFAISHRKETWPRDWPVGSFVDDNRREGETRPSLRAGRWNGAFGPYIRATQESYYVMDDRENDEFSYYPFDDKRPWPDGRRGLGFTVTVRDYQWVARLSEDIMISTYDIVNNGKDLEKCVVGMYIDPDMGGSLSGDDAAFDRQEDITYAWSASMLSEEGWPMGYFGFAFLESPGLPFDGVDNDEDGMTDEAQNNDIDDDGDWRSFEDRNSNGVWDSEDLNRNGLLDENEDVNGNGRLDYEPLNDDTGSDGLSPESDEYIGPDPNGTEGNGRPDGGEPNFEFTDNSESDQVGLTSFYLRDVDDTMADDEKYWVTEIVPNTFAVRPGYQRDIAWSYGSGYVAFTSEANSHHYAIALLFGNDEADILRNKRTMQVIYDNDYNFAKPPRTPLLTAIGGDKKVYLSWDDAAERSRDPIYGLDFEAYYIYRSTDASFGEIKTITDGFGNPLLFKPVAIYDLKDGLKGIHPIRLGSELGADSDLGVSYNMGSDSGLRHNYTDTTVTNGRTYYYAVVSIDKGYHPSFYPSISDREGLLPISPTECSATIQTDPLGRAIWADRNTAIVIPRERPAGWQQPKIGGEGVRHVQGDGTGLVAIRIVNPLAVRDNHTYSLQFRDDGAFFELDSSFTGLTQRISLFSVNGGNSLALYSVDDPNTSEAMADFIYDGFQVLLENHDVAIDTAYWAAGASALALIDMTQTLSGIALPRDYEIRIMELGAYKPVNIATTTNFQVWDVTDPQAAFQVEYRFTESKSSSVADRGLLKSGCRVILVNSAVDRRQTWKWDFGYPAESDSAAWTMPAKGDLFKILTSKPFDRYDRFEFTMLGNTISGRKIAADLEKIYTVPDPYIAASTLERKVINQEEGRGDRRIDFVNLPPECHISIFTASGRLVRELNHNGDATMSRESWDLRTRDGLEITHGVYFYVVEAPGIGVKRGKLAVIK